MDEPIFVDTNVFLRFLVRDVEPFYQKAKELFEKAEEGEVKLETNELVIAEIVWALESYYDFSKAEIKKVIDSILDTKNLKVANQTRIKEAVGVYASGRMDFIDSYNISYIKAKGFKKVATFDIKHFKNVEGIASIW